jgi:type IV pilus assembly protein PilX
MNASLTEKKRLSRNSSMIQVRSQSGVVLVMTLVILLVVTLLGASSIQLTGLQERMSRNATDAAFAFGSAEAALRAAEIAVEAENSLGSYTNDASTVDNKYSIEAVNSAPIWSNATWWNTAANGIVVPTYGTTAGTNREPKYLIEFIKTSTPGLDVTNIGNVGSTISAEDTHYFRVTARGIGRTAGAKIYMQTTYGKQF